MSVKLVGDFGRIWTQAPHIQADGLVAKLARGAHGQRKGARAGAGVAFAPDSAAVAAVDAGGQVVVYHIRRNRFTVLNRNSEAADGALVFSTSRPNHLFAAMTDRTVACYEVDSRAVRARLAGHRSPVKSLNLNATGDLLVTCSPDSVRLWDAGSLKPLQVLSSGPYGASYSCFLPEGELVTSFRNGSTWLWDSGDMECMRKIRPPLVQNTDIALAEYAVSPDGQLLAAVGRHSLLLIWDLNLGKLNTTLMLPSGKSSQVQFLSEPNLVAVLGSDGVVRFVDLVSSACRFEVRSAATTFASFSVDEHDNYIALLDTKSDVWLYDLDNARVASKPYHLERVLATEGSAEKEALPLSLSQIQHHRPAARTWKKGAPKSKPKKRLDSPSHPFSSQKLKALLLEYGEYPEQYRMTIWKKLLQTPANEKAFELLVAKGMHPGFAEVAGHYPIQDESLLRKLAVLWSALSHWCPLLANVPYLAAFVFPFAKIFGSDQLGCFEAVATILMNWAHNWFEMFPSPPLSMLSAVEKVLVYHDKALAESLGHKGGVQAHAWSMLQSSMTEVLSTQEWLKLWDHIISNDPTFLYYVSVSFMIYFRNPIMSAGKEEDLQMFFRRSSVLDINTIVKTAYSLQASTPQNLHVPTKDFESLKPGNSYSLFNNFPNAEINAQIKEQERIRAEEEALMRRRQIAQEIEQQTHAIAANEAQLAEERKRIASLEAEKKQQLYETEKDIRAQNMEVEDRIREARLNHVKVVNQTYNATLQRQREKWAEQTAGLQAEVARKSEELSRELQSQLEEEKIKALENQAQRRLWVVQEESEASTRMARIQQQVQNKIQEIDNQKSIRMSTWAAEDEERKMRMTYEESKRDRLLKEEEELIAKAKAESVVLEHQIRSEMQMEQVKHERAMQQIAEEMSRLTADAVEAAKHRHSIAEANSVAALQKAMNLEQETYASKKAEREKVISEARALVAVKEEALQGDMLRAKQQRWWAEHEAKLSEYRKDLGEKDAVEKQRLQIMLERLETQHKEDQQLHNDMLMHESWLQQKAENVAMLSNLQQRISSDERKEFDKLRDNLGQQHKEAQEASRKQHEELMTKLIAQRDEQLLELETEWRKDVAHKEVKKIQEEEQERQAMRAEAISAYTERQTQIRGGEGPGLSTGRDTMLSTDLDTTLPGTTPSQTTLMSGPDTSGTVSEALYSGSGAADASILSAPVAAADIGSTQLLSEDSSSGEKSVSL